MSEISVHKGVCTYGHQKSVYIYGQQKECVHMDIRNQEPVDYNIAINMYFYDFKNLIALCQIVVCSITRCILCWMNGIDIRENNTHI